MPHAQQATLTNQTYIKPPTKPRKVNPQKIKQLAAIGLPVGEIAKSQGVTRSTVWRWLQELGPENHNLHAFKSRRADVLAHIQLKAHNVMQMILDSYGPDDVRNMSVANKTGLMGALNNVAGTNYDKERLETGQATHHVSVLVGHIEQLQRRAGGEA